MRILFVADGRSPTTHSWLQYWVQAGHEIHLVSTFPCEPLPGLSSFHVFPVAFGKMAGKQSGNRREVRQRPSFVNRLRGSLRVFRYSIGPLTLARYQRQLRRFISTLQPDLVHALRIPFEGMLASVTPKGIPLVVSIWGNDLTLHALGSFLMSAQTRRALRRADGLIADTARDIRLGREWGFAANRPTLVVPGGGGIDLKAIREPGSCETLPEELPAGPIIVNPRGQRPGSLRQDIFFQAIQLVLEKIPQAMFVCPPLAGDYESEQWVNRLRVRERTRLWPQLSHDQLIALFKMALVFVSPSIHDGTPNSLLEAMACGCFPVVGNIESMREWIVSGQNGLLVDATAPRSVADGIIAALECAELRASAKKENARIIAERAEYGHCMEMTEAFYRSVGER